MSGASVGRRMCAVLAVCSVALHAVLLAHADAPAMVAAMAMMMVACLYCARDLWSRGTLGVWCAMALMNLAMVALHMPAPGHHHGVAAQAQAQTSTTMTTATLLALLEVVIAAAVLTYRTRHRSVFMISP